MVSGGKAAGEAAAKGAKGIVVDVAKAAFKAGEKDVGKDGAKKAARKAAKREGKYWRPKGFRKGVRKKVWDNARNPDGLVRDPLTGRVMKKDEPWDMGHKPGYEFRKHKASAEERGISRKKFLDEHNDPSHYRPELPSSNQGHQAEDHTDDYFGP